MARCNSCSAVLANADRFCPACGTPHTNGKLHPRFGPVPNEPPGPPKRPSAPPADKPFCPRCWAVVRLLDPWCARCGMDLDGVREEAALAGYLGVWTTPGPTTTRGYQPQRSLTLALRVALAVVVLLGLTISAAAALSLARYEQIFSALRLDEESVTRWDGLLQVTMVAAVVVSAVCFLIWVIRSYRNLPALGVTPLRMSTSRATAVWFIPFVNLVLSKEVVDDLWRGSDPEVPPLSPAWRLQTVPYRVHLWWVTLLTSGVLLVAAQWALPELGAEDAAAARAGLMLAMLAHLAAAAAALLTLFVVQEVADRQERRVERIGVVRGLAKRPFRAKDRTDPRPPAPEKGRLLVHANRDATWGRY